LRPDGRAGRWLSGNPQRLTLVSYTGFFIIPLGIDKGRWWGRHMEGHPARPVPELAGLAEVAAILGVSKQRVRELTERDDFPKPVAQLSGGAIYIKSAVEAFNSHWNRKSGRPGRYQTQVLAELAHIPKDNADLAQQTLRMIYNNTRLHDLSRDAPTSPGRTLFHAIKLTQQEFQNFEPRYDQSFFRPEPRIGDTLSCTRSAAHPWRSGWLSPDSRLRKTQRRWP
jgi:hypothetical protein